MFEYSIERKCCWKPVGFRMNLLRRWEMGPFFRSFSLNSHHYSPQMIEKLSAISHSPRDDHLNPTGS